MIWCQATLTSSPAAYLCSRAFAAICGRGNSQIASSEVQVSSLTQVRVRSLHPGCVSPLSLRSWLVLEFWLLTWLSFGRILSSKSSSRTCLLQKEEAETWLFAQDGRQMHARMHESLETRIRKWIDGLMGILIDRQVMWACERGCGSLRRTKRISRQTPCGPRNKTGQNKQDKTICISSRPLFKVSLLTSDPPNRRLLPLLLAANLSILLHFCTHVTVEKHPRIRDLEF